jgi:PAS domain S-box-containing protein
MDEKSDSHFESKPAESEQLSRINQQLQAANQQLAASEQQLRAANQQLRAAHQQLKAEEQQLRAASQQLRAANQQLKAEQQQLRAANQQLKTTEEKLRETNQNLQAVIQASPLPIFAVDRELIVKTWNPAAERTFGWGAQEVIGRQYPAIPDEKKDEADILFSRAMERGLVGVETIRQRKDGSLIEVSISAAPLRDSRSNINGVMAVIVDITERKQAQKELQRLAGFWESIVQNANVYMDVLDENRNVLLWNKAAEKISGYSADEVVGHDKIWQWQYPDPQYRNDVVKTATKVIEGKEELREFESVIVTKSGEKRVISWYSRNLTDENGKSIGSVATGIDITERKKAEDTLEKAEKEKATILDTMSELVAYQDTEHRIIWANRASGESVGSTAGELLGRYCYQIWHRRNKACANCPAEKAQKTGRLETAEIKSPDGRFWFIRANPVRDAAGNIIGAVEITLDITERKKAEQELRDSRNILRTVLDSIPVTLFWKDRDSVYLGANRALLEEAGLTSSEEIVGKSDYDLPWGKKHADSFRQDDRRVMESGIPEYDIVEFYLRADGTHAWAKTNKVPLRDTEGNVVGVLGTSEDITERKKAEQELQKAHDELEKRVEQRTAQLMEASLQLQKETAERLRKEEMLFESERLAAVGSLAAKIAHEINNPLAGIKNSFLLIKDSIPDNHPYYKYVGLIEKEIERVSDIVRQMYDLYRPVQAQQRRFRLREAVDDVVDLLKVASEEHKVNVNIDIDKSIIVKLPDGLLRQVLFNVIQNAIEASQPDSKVKVKAEICEGVLNMQIIDTGVGISKDIRNKIFEPFFTSKRDSTKRSLGLGLSVCKNIVDAIGGEVAVQSRAGKGTTFTIKIPLEDSNAKQNNS